MAYHYREDLKPLSRRLRIKLTDAEQKLWYRLRRKQILGVQFYRQRPILEYILDFFAPTVKLAIEVDGGQHFDAAKQAADQLRDARLRQQGITVLRFTNYEVLQEMEAVLNAIYQYIEQRKQSESN